MLLQFNSLSSLTVAVTMVFIAATPVRAGQLTLTQAGIDLGFNLTNFVSGYAFGTSSGGGVGYGPLSQAVLPNGNVITGNRGDNQIYIFHDVDGQTLGSAVATVPYAPTTANGNWSFVTAGGQVYGAQSNGGSYVHFGNDGSFSPVAGLAALTNYYGMSANPANGHIIAGTNLGLVDIDPVAGTFRVINAGLFADGLTVSADGSTIFLDNDVALPGTIESYRTSDGSKLQSYNLTTPYFPDGLGVITTAGPLKGYILVNNNGQKNSDGTFTSGSVGLLNPLNPNQYVIIATGGSRGDFISPDTSDGSLFLSYQDQVVRLSLADPAVSPEPASVGLFGIGCLAMGLMYRRRHA